MTASHHPRGCAAHNVRSRSILVSLPGATEILGCTVRVSRLAKDRRLSGADRDALYDLKRTAILHMVELRVLQPAGLRTCDDPDHVLAEFTAPGTVLHLPLAQVPHLRGLNVLGTRHDRYGRAPTTGEDRATCPAQVVGAFGLSPADFPDHLRRGDDLDWSTVFH